MTETVSVGCTDSAKLFGGLIDLKVMRSEPMRKLVLIGSGSGAGAYLLARLLSPCVQEGEAVRPKRSGD